MKCCMKFLYFLLPSVWCYFRAQLAANVTRLIPTPAMTPIGLWLGCEWLNKLNEQLVIPSQCIFCHPSDSDCVKFHNMAVTPRVFAHEIWLAVFVVSSFAPAICVLCLEFCFGLVLFFWICLSIFRTCTLNHQHVASSQYFPPSFLEN